MKGKNALSFLMVVLFPLIGSAEGVKYEISSKTLWFLFQEERGNADATLAPIYEFLSISATDGGVKGLSVHLSVWGNFQTLDWWEGERSEGKLLYGYVRYRNPKLGIDAKGGRIFVFSGASAPEKQFDGGYFSYTLKKATKFEIYGGSPFNELDESRKGDYLAGTRFSHRWNDKLEFGISYLYEAEKDDVNFNRIGIDGWSFFSSRFNLNGYLSYDITYNKLAEGSLIFSYWTNMKLWKELNVEMNYRNTSSFLGNQSVLSAFAFGNYINPRIKFLFITSDWRVIPSYETMVYLDTSRHAHRLSLRLSKFFSGGDYIPILEISRLQISDDVDWTELKTALHAKIIGKITSDFEFLWDIFDKKIRIGEEEVGYGFQTVLSITYEILEWMKVSAGMSLYEGILSDWNFKGLGKLEILL